MSKDDKSRGPDDEKNHDVPNDPEMKLQPTGPLLEMGNAYARQEQRQQLGPTGSVSTLPMRATDGEDRA